MENFEEALNKAKEVASVAYKKTEETIIIQKLNFDIARRKTKLKDDYAALGKSVYKKGKYDAAEEQEIIEHIEFLKDEIKALRAEIKRVKI